MKDNMLEMWKPQQDFGIVFDDKTGENRSNEELNEMFEKLRDVANEHGFDVNLWNSGYITGFTYIENDDEE